MVDEDHQVDMGVMAYENCPTDSYPFHQQRRKAAEGSQMAIAADR
jgi:hypothetical protein